MRTEKLSNTSQERQQIRPVDFNVVTVIGLILDI
jgi:hypothetical protein